MAEGAAQRGGVVVDTMTLSPSRHLLAKVNQEESHLGNQLRTTNV